GLAPARVRFVSFAPNLLAFRETPPRHTRSSYVMHDTQISRRTDISRHRQGRPRPSAQSVNSAPNTWMATSETPGHSRGARPTTTQRVIQSTRDRQRVRADTRQEYNGAAEIPEEGDRTRVRHRLNWHHRTHNEQLH